MKAAPLPRTVLLLLLGGLPSSAFADEAGDGARPLEGAVVPVFGGDTDIGIGAGLIGSVARPQPGPDTFRWKIEGAAFGTVKVDEGSAWMPFQDAYVQLTRTGLLGGRLRVELRPSYTRESNLRYYGLGNAAPAPHDDLPARDFYLRVHPTGRLRARLQLAGPWHLLIGSSYVDNQVDMDPASRLAADLAKPPPGTGSLLHLTPRHGVNLYETALVFDTRDDEVSPTRGQHHQIGARVSPWQTAFLPFRYMGLSANLRVYLPLLPDRLTLAARMVGDILLGTVPVYELARFEETSALGGAKFVRGIPSNRYYGKRKTMGNLELRSRLFRFRPGTTQYTIGLTGFLDGGRVWADTTSAPELDGTGRGLKYGVGGGLRFQKGETFVLRGDVAWSPDARPVGMYLLAGHLF